MNWETFPRVRVGVSYTTPMIPPELTHAASSEPSVRRRQYVAPSHELPNDVEHTSNHHHHNNNNDNNDNNNNNNNNNSHIYHSHSRHATQIVIPPSSPQVTPNNTNNNNGRYRDSPHDTTSHPCGNHSHEEHQKATRIRMFLPVSFPETTESGERRDHELHSWRDLPPNPLNGLPGLTTQVAPVGREDCRFYCDSCQKGFYTQDRYDKHMTDHIWCTVPGCRFTCRKGKEWKMEIHMETLHNRPDAPNLADVETYLSQRKARFPTQVSVKSKVEELFYKASRGVALPEERRRWLRQHGILVRKHPRTEETYIDLDALRPSTRTVASKATERNPVKQRLEKKQGDTEEQEDEDEKEDDEAEDDEEAAEEEGTREMNIPPPTTASGEAVEDTHAREHPSAPAQQQQHPPRGGRPKRIVPRGPNGTLTRGQQVQLVREKYKGATTVPRFYVCHRCGAKGAHWVDDCPTRGDSAFERQTVWGEERREPPRRKQRVEVDAGEEKAVQNINANECPSPGGEEVKSLRADDWVALEIVEDNDGGPPAEMPARRQAAEEAVVEVTRVIAPAAAAASVKKGRKTPQLQQGHGRHPESSVSQPQSQSRPRARPRRPPPPTLYERLLEGREVNERGLLLQAIRFFVMRKFFEPF